MAEKERDSITSLDLGIESTGIAGNLQAAEAFLSGDSSILDNPDDITEIDEEEEELAKSKKVEAKTEKKIEPKKVEPKKEEKKEEEVDVLGKFEEDNEDEEEEEEKKEEKKEDDVEKNDAGFNEYESLSKDLFKIGVFTPTEGEEDISKIKIDTPELLKSRFEKEGQIKATQWLDGLLSRFGDDRKELFEAVFIDGVDINEYIPLHTELQNLKGADLTQESVQERVFKEYYKRIGWDEDTISRKLQKSKDYGDLADDAKELHPQLIAQDEEREEDLKNSKIEARAVEDRMDKEYKVSIAKILEEKAKNRDFDGIPLNDKKKTQAFDFLYTKKYKTADGRSLTEFDKFIIDTRRPENHALRVKIALLALDNFDLTKVEKRAVSKESSAIFSELAQKKTKKTGGAQSVSKGVTSWFQ